MKDCDWNSREQYDLLIGPLREVAREHGYALTVHGTLKRDIDLVAVPWVNTPSDPKVLSEAIRQRAALINPIGVAFIIPAENDDYHKNGCPGLKPHGRLCWVYQLGGGPAIDLSVIPPRNPPYDDD